MSLDDPPRLTDPASGAPDELRSLFEAGTRDVPSAGELARLATKLGPVLGPGATVSGGSAAGIGKLALVVGALVGGAVLVSSLTREVPTNVPDAPPLPQKEVAPKPENPPKLEPPVATQAPAAETPSAPPSTVERPVRRAEQLSNAELEVELLERARAALAGNPAHALSLTSEHKLRFPGGTLAQEREVIAIEALRRLGKNDQARLRADEFAKHYPGSAHRHKLDAGVTQ